MFNFSQFLSEGAKNKEFNVNDAKGKLFEILAGSHIKHGSDNSGKPAAFLTHYRDENGSSPQAVHDYIKRELQKRHPGMYEQINDHAREAAQRAKDYLKSQGHHTVNEVAWTSQKADHKSFTGVEDANSDADIMLHTNKGPIGVSLKYGTQKNPNLRNPGLDSIEQLAGLKKGAITGLYNQHQKNVRDLGFTGSQGDNHEEFKANKNSKKAVAAVDSGLRTRREIARSWQNGYARMNSDQLREKIVSLVSPETKFEHFRMHTRPTAAGVGHHIGHIQDDIRNALSNYAEFKALPHSGSGISVQILGRHHDSDEFHPVITHGVKGTSGPMKGMNGTTTLSLKSPKAPKAQKVSKATKNITPDEMGSGEHGGKSFHGPGELSLSNKFEQAYSGA
jgi:hypothetical protein